MRIIQTAEMYGSELTELRCSATVAASAGEDEEKRFRRKGLGQGTYDYEVEDNAKVVCITSGLTFLGRAIVERLLLHGYSVRVIVHGPDDGETVRQMRDETAAFYGRMETVTAMLTEVDSLVKAFDGCNGVFHTSGFIDPSGVSGYSKYMADLEAKVSENVMDACTRTQSVRRCVMTSSLLACIWQNGTQSDLPSLVDHSCWSDESLCKDKKLWYALGKLKAEKNAWKMAEANKGLKLSTICPALITAPNLLHHNPTPTIAYLKGANEMYENGLLATVEIDTVAKTHVRVYEAMRERKRTFGRYVCFDKMITTEYEAEELSKQTGLNLEKIRGTNYGDSTTPFRLSLRNMSSLFFTSSFSCLHHI